MRLALFSVTTFPLAEVAAALHAEGVAAVPGKLDWRQPEVPPDCTMAALVAAEPDLIRAGEAAGRLRELVGAKMRLLLCTPQPLPDDRALLLQCGATDVLTPRSWAVAHLAERLLAELILNSWVQPTSCGTMHGATALMREAYAQIETLAPLHEPVLILAESGAGKELAARALHDLSGRNGQWLPINCAELGRDLLQSELFGHEKGSFTGATQARKGLLAEAGEGTVFLDEIGELDKESQAKLLRVLEEKTVRRVGANKLEAVRARVVLATNRDLEQEVEEGRFKHDLLMRLQGFTLRLPALRERRADLPLLVRHFVNEYNREYGLSLQAPPGALERLFEYDWPGNVRELRAAVWRAAAFGDKGSGYLSAKMLWESVRRRAPEPPQTADTRHAIHFDPAQDTWHHLVERARRSYFEAVVASVGGNVTAAAKRAGLSRSQFYEKWKGQGPSK